MAELSYLIIVYHSLLTTQQGSQSPLERVQNDMLYMFLPTSHVSPWETELRGGSSKIGPAHSPQFRVSMLASLSLQDRVTRNLHKKQTLCKLQL